MGGVFGIHSRFPSYHRSASVTPPTWYLPPQHQRIVGGTHRLHVLPAGRHSTRASRPSRHCKAPAPPKASSRRSRVSSRPARDSSRQPQGSSRQTWDSGRQPWGSSRQTWDSGRQPWGSIRQPQGSSPRSRGSGPLAPEQMPQTQGFRQNPGVPAPSQGLRTKISSLAFPNPAFRTSAFCRRGAKRQSSRVFHSVASRLLCPSAANRLCL